ncbi:MAG: polyprenyl synthetase family protein [Candidatus Saccharibacteria bacterium]|nr:polyprenyl synthetase family protein [Candidatus Saccharibacteria bacterium]
MQNTTLKEKLIEISNAVEPVIKQILTENVDDSTSEMVFYQCSLGGKRIRPALVILSGQVFGGDVNGLLYPAASVEVLHNSTLVIDDIIDHSEVRRDQPTVWKKYGKSMAECVAIDYQASIFSSLNNVNNSKKLIELYAKTLKIIVDGEIKDILFERSGRTDEDYVVNNRYKVISKDDYFKMISQKTAILLQASCKAGAIYANATDEQVALMGEFGFNIGIAFQIRDDMLDIFADEKEFGKKVGKDIIEKKMGNYIILLALEKLDDEGKNFITSLLEGSNEVTDQDVAKVTELVEKTNAKSDAEKTAEYFINKAMDALGKLPQNEATGYLGELANFIVKRSK